MSLSSPSALGYQRKSLAPGRVLIAFPSVSVRFHRARLIGLGSWFPSAECAAILSSARAQRDSPTLSSFPGEEQRPTACACHSSSWFFDFLSRLVCGLL
jgi:hypothetical protein